MIRITFFLMIAFSILFQTHQEKSLKGICSENAIRHLIRYQKEHKESLWFFQYFIGAFLFQTLRGLSLPMLQQAINRSA